MYVDLDTGAYGDDEYARNDRTERTGPAALAEVERLTAERDWLAAQVARVEKLAGQWERLAETAINPDSREWLQACSKTLRECLSGWQRPSVQRNLVHIAQRVIDSH